MEKEDEGIKLSGVFHKKCGKEELTDFGGYVWCDQCNEIVRDEDIVEVGDEKNKKHNN